MNNEEPIRDQAEKLRKKIEILQSQPEEVSVEKSNDKLPPRSRVHNHTQKKTKVKVKYPVLRILGLFFVLLPIVVFSVYTYNHSTPLPASEEDSGSDGYETVSIPVDDGDDVLSTEASTEDQTAKEKNQNTNEVVDDSNNALTSSESQPATEQNAKTEVAPTQESQPVTKKPQSVTTTPDVRYHVVQPGETLYRIAMKYFKSQNGITIIREANNLNGNEIKVGQKLTIPLNK